MFAGHPDARVLTGWLLFRFVKFLGVALFAAGLLGAVLPARQKDRLTAAHGPASVGLLLTWLAGYGMMKHLGLSMKEAWIGWGILASLVALGGAASAASRPEARPLSAAIAAAGFFSAMGTMVTKSTDAALGLVVPAVAAVVAYVAVRGLREHHGDLAQARAATLAWFTWVARFEGASLLFMLGVSIPLRKLAGINIDGGQGWVGWVHGVLTLVYIVALASAARVDGWSIGKATLGFVASVVPFGTFGFERGAARRGAALG